MISNIPPTELQNRVIPVDEKIGIYNINPKNGKKFMLRELREYFNKGFAYIINLQNGMLMIIDQDGEAKSLPVNRRATELVKADIKYNILGDVVVISEEQFNKGI